jgi:acyl-CoA synthetase (AMP-forming)/AMP-acid ligase II/thioesterase domain-containing protein
MNEVLSLFHALPISAHTMALLDIMPSPQRTWSCFQDCLEDDDCCLQDILSAVATSGRQRCLRLYPLGNTSTPTEVSYTALHAQAQHNSLIVRSLTGFKEGRPVLLHTDDHWDTILWFWAILLANGLPVLSSPFSNVDDQRHKHIHGLSSLLESPICITRSKFISQFGHDHTLQLHTIESLRDIYSPLDLAAATRVRARYNGHVKYGSGKAPAMLMLTSGSTGNAKAVSLTHNQLLAAISGKASVRPLPAGRPFLNWIGLDHVASLVEIHLQAMWLGVDQVHVHASDIVTSPRKFLDLLDRHQVSRSFAPNFFLAKLVATVPADATWDLSNLTVLASGGEANDVQTCVASSALFEKHGACRNVVTPGFGMTETCAGAIFNTDCPDYDVKHGRSVACLGRCMKGIEMRVTVPGSRAKLAPRNTPGDLEVRGEVVFDGYYRNPEANAEAFTWDGWFRTGDQAAIDSVGNLRMIGRAKDVIIINGVKFALADMQTSLEEALGSRVARIVVFPKRAAHTEQIVVAYLPKQQPIPVEDMAEIDELVGQACMVATASSPVIFALGQTSVDMLPMSALGKISRAKMRTLFEEGMFTKDVDLYCQATKRFKEKRQQRSRLLPVTNAEASLIDDFAETVGIEPKTIGVDTPVFELGFTSMDLIKLKHRIDTRLHIMVPVVLLMKHPTARLLAAALEASYGSTNPIISTAVVYDPVVTFRSSGTKTPLWLVHPGVGEVLVFMGLAQDLADDDRPVYALRARGFEPGQVGFASIGEAVDTYVAAIRQQQPQGPYALAGYSYGAMLAFEVAKKLNARDGGGKGTVRFFGSFNLPPHIKPRMRQLNWNMCLLHLTYFLGLTTEAFADIMEQRGFHNESRDEALKQITDIVDTNRMDELGLGRQQLVSWVDVAYGLQSMAVDYEPEGIVDAIDVFHATPLKVAAPSREVWIDQHLSKWRNFCRTEVTFHEVGGAHYTMIGPDHVLGFSAKLKAALAARGL